MTKRKFDTESNRRITKKMNMVQTDILIPDGTLKYDFMTSLQNITTAKIVTYLWMRGTIQQEIINLLHLHIRSSNISSDFDCAWRQIENNVVTKTSELLLPDAITKSLTTIVPLVGNSILNWIRYNDQHIFDTSEYSKYMAVDYLGNLAWTTRGKVDYQRTAKNILAKEDNDLSNDHKYKLACTYCLEDEIAVLAPKVANKYYLNYIKFDLYPMVYFWTAHITGDYTQLDNPLYYDYSNRSINDSNLSINEKIFWFLTNNNSRIKRTFNEVPIKYMWDKLSEEEKARNIISVIEELDNQDLRYSLLSTLNYDQQQEIFKECSRSILKGIFHDWLWREYFLSTALHVLDIMHPYSYLAILDEVIKAMHNNSQEDNEYVYNHYKSIFKKLWSEAPKHLKLHGFITCSFSWEKDMDVIQLILNDLTASQKQELVFSDSGISRCTYFIKNNQWDLLNLFIKHTLFGEEDIVQFKQKLIKVKGREIAEHFLEKNALDKIEYFMSWAFNSDEEINWFRQNLAHSKCQSTLEAIIANNKVDFKELEDHFKWCAADNIEIINQFKFEIPKLCYGQELMSTLIAFDQYQLLDQFLNWCFLGDHKKIEQFKSNMYKDDYLGCFIRDIPCILMEKDHSLKLLDKFVNWCFANKEKIDEFKQWILYPQKDGSSSICTDLLCEDKLELADKFIKWCIRSPEEISKFKRILMISEDMEYIIDPGRDDPQDKLCLLIQWFNPTKETVEEFKKLLPESECPDNFYKLLDEFAKTQSNLVINSQLNDLSQDIQVGLDNQSYHIEGTKELTISTIGVESASNIDFI